MALLPSLRLDEGGLSVTAAVARFRHVVLNLFIAFSERSCCCAACRERACVNKQDPCKEVCKAIPKCYISKLLDLDLGPKDNLQKNVLHYTVLESGFLGMASGEVTPSSCWSAECPNGPSHFGVLKQ